MLPEMTHAQSKATTEQIWHELNDRLRQFVRSRFTSAADVDDIVQTVFLRIHAKSEDLRNVDRLESWVFQIARNAVIDHYRKHHVTESDVETLAGDDRAEDENVNAEVSQCLRTLIDRLPNDQRRAVSLYELEGMPQKEIAERESISLSGAKSRIQRGRKSLENMLLDCCRFQLDTRGNILDYQANNADCCGDECG